MVLYGLWRDGRCGSTVWNTELVFFVVVGFMISFTVTADANKDQHLEGLTATGALEALYNKYRIDVDIENDGWDRFQVGL